MKWLFKLLYRVMTKTRLLLIFVNPLTKRVARTGSWYAWKVGLLPRNPLQSQSRMFISHSEPNTIVPTGTHLQGVNAYKLPVFLFITINETNEAQLVGLVEQLQTVTFGFKPLFITDSTSLDIYTMRGYMSERIIDEKHWSRLTMPISWKEYVEQRKNDLIAFHRPSRVINLRDLDSLYEDVLHD